MKPSFLLPAVLAATLPAADAAAEATMSLTLNVNSEIRLNAGQPPQDTAYYAWPFLAASDDDGNPLAQAVKVASPGGNFEGYINHPMGWSASSSVFNDPVAVEDELFNNGDWTLRDFASFDGPPNPAETVYSFSVTPSPGFLDGLAGTLITDNAHLLDPGAPTFEWTNPGGLFEAVNVYLFDLTDTSLGTSDLLDGDATSWSPSYTLVPGHEYQLFVNQRRDTSGLVAISDPIPDDPSGDSFPYLWSSSADVNANGIYDFTAVPEPHEYALLAGAGLLGFALWRRVRRAARV
jgi:hypothetical protein